MRRTIILAVTVLGALANVVPGFASSAHAALTTNHNETFVRDQL
jgi:hypothetical protein